MSKLRAFFREKIEPDDGPSGLGFAGDLFLPMCAIDGASKIFWRNEAFAEAFGALDFPALFPLFKAESALVQAQVYGERQYELQAAPLESGRLVLALDVTERERLRAASSQAAGAVCILNIDNYEELGSNTQLARGAILTQFENRLYDWAKSIDGFVRRYDRDRYLLFIERRQLDELRKQKFPLLAMAHGIDTGGAIPLSLTIAAGTGETIAESGEFARQALDLALGRGGDQAVVKDGSGFSFYGGKSQTVEKVSRVKVRTFALALHHLIEASDGVFLMGHIMPDLDCMGAALGLFRMARISGKPAYIVLDAPNATIERLIDELQKDPEYEGALIAPEAARSLCTGESVLIVFDTQRRNSTIEPALFEKTKNLVVIDHHRRGLNAIEEATLSCLEPYASSTCELVTETLQYYHGGAKLRPLEASALLAGISVDTKNFSFNTGARTFDAASYLRRNGADVAGIKRLSQDDMNTFRDRARVVERAENITDDIVISFCDPDSKNAPLIAAQAADALTTIRGIQAAFVLGINGGCVSVSGRSLGGINVQVILEKLGGGGHMTSAGAQLMGVSQEEAAQMIRGAVLDYIKEVGEK